MISRRIAAVALFCALAAAAAGLPAAPVTLPAGILVELELQHHVNSAYIHAGSPIYFRVAKDVSLNNEVLIRHGTLVTGKMQQANARGMIGKSGSMLLVVERVAAVDGSHVQVDADLSKQGRSRSGATVAWTIFWGLPGLITRGVNPYLERGAIIDAKVVDNVNIDPARAAAAVVDAAPAAAPLPLTINAHRFSTSKRDPFPFDIERNKDLKTVDFTITPSPEVSDPAALLRNLELVSVDGVPVPEQVKAIKATDKSVTFDAWSIVRFCRDGTTQLQFAGVTPDGRPFAGEDQVRVLIKKKKPKEKKA